MRVWLDPAKVAAWPEVNSWYLKLKPKAEQDKELLLAQIKEAGPGLLSWRPVKIRPQLLHPEATGPHRHLPPVPGGLSGPGWGHLPGLSGRGPLPGG